MSASQKPSDPVESNWSHIPDYKDIDYSKLTIQEGKTYTFFKNPVYIGGYQLGGKFGLKIAFTEKPCWFHRKMMKLCLGWEWVDDKP
jgi:hypothetical protein